MVLGEKGRRVERVVGGIEGQGEGGG